MTFTHDVEEMEPVYYRYISKIGSLYSGEAHIFYMNNQRYLFIDDLWNPLEEKSSLLTFNLEKTKEEFDIEYRPYKIGIALGFINHHDLIRQVEIVSKTGV